MPHLTIPGVNLKNKLLVAAAVSAAVAAPIILGIVGALRLGAQPAAALTFEVASVKPVIIPAGTIVIPRLLVNVPFRISGSHVSVRESTVTELICEAYDVEDFQVFGAPVWASATGDRFNIQAAAPGDVPPTVDQARVMFQALLAERFQLKLHRDSKQLPGYRLVIGKKGSKLTPVSPSAPLSGQRPSMQQTSMQQLVSNLSRVLGRPVLDQTGLSGVFNNSVAWVRLAQVKRTDPDQLATAELSSVLEESVGLKLESAKDPVTILVIDHVEKPSEN